MDEDVKHTLSLKRLQTILGDFRTSISPSRFTMIEQANIKPREFLYGRSIIRKYVSLLVAPGGVGKSALTIMQALAMVTGKPLLGEHVHRGALRVSIMGLEDPYDELERRIIAACSHYGITSQDIGGDDCRLFVNSGRDQKLCITMNSREGAIVDDGVKQDLIEEIKFKNIDVVIIDPFVSSHSASENDNVAMDAVAKAWADIADKANCAILLVHHSRKLNGEQISAEAARGASSVLAAARSGCVINPMTENEAAKLGMDTHRGYFRVIDDKSNIAPPVDKSDWYRIVNVTLQNGDHVGVVERWQPPNPYDAITPNVILMIQSAVAGQGYRENVQAKLWVGHIVGKIIGFDASTSAGRFRANVLMRSWIEEGYFIVVERPDENRRPRKFVEVGQFIQVAPPDNAGAGYSGAV
ncbi:MAG: AAA family ATPase [Candidatus Pacebacteria bacterium]|nr:AAA family ATPase [Candidatus Paceibacterota bacterium]